MATVMTCVRWSPFLLLFTIASSSTSGQTTTFNGTISTGDTVVLSQAGTYSIANSQLGSYGGGSFALGSMTYDVNTSLNSSKNEYSGFTAVSFMTVSVRASNTHSGATTSGSCLFYGRCQAARLAAFVLDWPALSSRKVAKVD